MRKMHTFCGFSTGYQGSIYYSRMRKTHIFCGLWFCSCVQDVQMFMFNFTTSSPITHCDAGLFFAQVVTPDLQHTATRKSLTPARV